MNTTIPAEISAFAAQVRAALADLPADELEELTEGLEADLSEAYAEDLARELPDPSAYAAELRAAAGLPEPEVGRSGLRAGLDSLREGVGESVRDVGVVVRRHPAGRATLEFLGSLGPVWWVARAWVAARVVGVVLGTHTGFLPSGLLGWLVLVLAVVVSVQWGRGLWRGRLGALIVVGNVVAAVLLVPLAAGAANSSSYAGAYDVYDDAYADAIDQQSEGISMDGRSVTNIYPYDASGKPLEDVQLFDQSGRALAPALSPLRDECANDCADGIDGNGRAWVPRLLESGREATNVFPLSLVQYVMGEDGFSTSTVAQPAEVPEAPYLKVPALAPAPQASASPSPRATPRGERD
jgi:hypothetical protein